MSPTREIDHSAAHLDALIARDAPGDSVPPCEHGAAGGDQCCVICLRAEGDRLRRVVDEQARKADAVRAEYQAMAVALAEATRQLAIVDAGAEGVWRWQGDGHDHPESLSCPVVMSADTLRALLGQRGGGQ